MAAGSPSLLDDDAVEQGPSRPGLPLDPARAWLSIRRGWKIVPMGMAAGALAGLLVALTVVKDTYKSEAILIWEPSGGGRTETRELSTQATILKTRVVLADVRERLKMVGPIEGIANSIDVWFDVQSNLVTIETTSRTAKGAFDLADALIAAFLDHQRTLAQTRAREHVEDLKADLKTASVARDEAQVAYDAFRTKHGIVDFEFDSQRALQALEELRLERNEAVADASALLAREEQLDALSRNQPRMRTSTARRSDPTATQVSTLRAQLAEARSRLAPDHPRLGLLAAQLAAAERHAQTGESVVADVTSVPDPAFEQTRSSLASTRAERAGLEKRRESLEAAVKEAEARVNSFTAIAGEARKLLAQVGQTAQRWQELRAELSRAQEAVRDSPVAFRVLTPPLTPEHPQASRRKVVVVGLTVLATLVCVAFLLIRPAHDGRVYTAREAAFWAGMPVLATSAWPRWQDSFAELVNELNDRAVPSEGTTLVVASRGSERELARTLAASLGPTPSPRVYAAPAEGNVVESQSTALATRQGNSAFFAWPGESEGPTLRRAARMSDRVLVVIRAGGESALSLASLRRRLGRDTRVAAVLVGVPDELLTLPDRVGNIEGYWSIPAPGPA